MLSYCILLILFVSGVYLQIITPTPIDTEKPLDSDPRDQWAQAARFIYIMLVVVVGILIYDAARRAERMILRCTRRAQQKPRPGAAVDTGKAGQGDQAV